MENLFQVLHESGKAHVLETDDFENYRRFCVRKIRKLHSKNKLTKSKDAPSSKELLEVLVFKCEWIWAQGSLLRSQLHSHPRKRFHLRRVAKSCFKVATKLKSVASKVFEAKDVNAYNSYADFLTAIASLDLDKIESAYKLACQSKQLLAKLDDQFALKKLEDVETLIRFIEYKAKGFRIDLSAHQAEVQVEELSNVLETTQITQKKQVKRIVHVAGSPVILSLGVVSVKSPANCLEISLKELSSCQNDENAQFQCLYFEIQRFKREFKAALAAFLKVYRQHSGFKALTAVKGALLRVKHAKMKPEIQNEIQNALSLLNAFTSVYKGQIEDAEFVCDNFTQSTYIVVPCLNRLFDALDCLIRRRSMPKEDSNEPESSNSLFNLSNLISQSKNGIMGMFSSFFSKPKQ